MRSLLVEQRRRDTTLYFAAVILGSMMRLAHSDERHESLFLPECTDCLDVSSGRNSNHFNHGEPANDTGTIAPPLTFGPSESGDFGLVSDIPSDSTSHSSGGGLNSIDVLVAVFFVISACWLFIAICYSILILIVLRLQAQAQERGEQLDVTDEQFGRFSFLGGRIRINISFLLRRYALQIEREQRMRAEGGDVEKHHFMTREERRMALGQLLASINDDQKSLETPTSDCNNDSTSGSSISFEKDDARDLEIGRCSSEEAVCSICLCEYDEDDQVFTSNTCSHQFHMECIMDWLERKANTECPCCRSCMVGEDDVWAIVKKSRKQNRKLPWSGPLFGRSSRWVRRTSGLNATNASTRETETPSGTFSADDDSTLTSGSRDAEVAPSIPVPAELSTVLDEQTNEQTNEQNGVVRLPAAGSPDQQESSDE